jgi:branched-chain amino acid aminotransferase
MEATSTFIVRKTRNSRLQEIDFNQLGFGKYISDHMLVSDYSKGEWDTPQLVPFSNLSLSPASLALHYGQTVFEGMKAFRMEDGRINIFRIEKHYERFVRSLERMCMAVVPKEIFVDGLQQLVELDRDWIPSSKGSALYLRPFMYASEAKFGIKISDEFRFIIFTGPVAEFYADPIKVKVERRFTRAAAGGTGYAKCGGNYGASYYPTKLAREEGFDQVLWTDGRDHEFIEESGMMNVMFVIDGNLITPPPSDTILDGVTRESLLRIAADLGYTCEVRAVRVDELIQAFRSKSITEAFGAGTAAVVAPIETIQIDGVSYHLPAYSHENIMFKIKNILEDIRLGRSADVYGWNFVS